MIARYAVVAGRIRQELTELERVVARVERADKAAYQASADQYLYLRLGRRGRRRSQGACFTAVLPILTDSPIAVPETMTFYPWTLAEQCC